MSDQLAPARVNLDAQQRSGSPTLETALNVLTELLRLKSIKDRDGETEDYRKNKDAAWAAARALVHPECHSS